MINRVVMVGRLTKDPEYRTTQSGVSVTTFTLAVNRTFTNAQGEREADFINCVTFRKQAENVNNYLNKGSLAGVDGRVQSRTYENDEGKRVFITEVVAESVQFLDTKNNNQQSYSQNSNNQPQQQRGQAQQSQSQPQNNWQQQQQQNKQQAPNQQNNPFANSNGQIDIGEDDLPF
ncbi:single-stranded DNA-binding protein [Staphylococcus saprophyticus]|nr:single-stranded DNA-binding protein [Staphylococcus saprophyticus]